MIKINLIILLNILHKNTIIHKIGNENFNDLKKYHSLKG